VIALSLLLLLAAFLHATDIFCTLQLIKKNATVFVNPEELEMNYHKFFLKKFGLHKGVLISMTISLIVIIIAITTLFITNNFYSITFILGMLTMIAFVNYMSLMQHDSIVKKLIRKKCGEQNG
jgi:hypothetical protein